jgi:hypothetical protein
VGCGNYPTQAKFRLVWGTRPASRSFLLPLCFLCIQLSLFSIYSLSKHLKSGGGKPHPDLHQGGAQHNKCDIPGSIDVRGVIETKLPPNLQKERDAAEEKKEVRDKRRFVIEGLTLIFAIIYAVLTGWYAFTNYYQWSDLRHNFAVEERSWIKVEFPKRTDDTTFNPFDGTVKVDLRNLGKSVILKSQMDAWVEILDRNSPPSFSSGNHDALIAGMIFPTDSVELQTKRYHPNGGVYAPTDSEAKALAGGLAYVAVYGHVVYYDDFGVHWTRFCAWFTPIDRSQPLPEPNFSAATCTTFNSAGEGDQPGQEPKKGIFRRIFDR